MSIFPKLWKYLGPHHVELWDSDVPPLPVHHPGGDAGGAPDQRHHAGQAVQLHDTGPQLSLKGQSNLADS